VKQYHARSAVKTPFGVEKERSGGGIGVGESLHQENRTHHTAGDDIQNSGVTDFGA
jgi:hypothetical protein